jgi:hypothetical protein
MRVKVKTNPKYKKIGTRELIRRFESGATRNLDDEKLDFEAFLSPLVIKRYAEYMHTNRKQADGSMRDGDNWQKGIDFKSYIKSGWRHFFSWWYGHRRNKINENDICALIFNASGYLHEKLKERNYE